MMISLGVGNYRGNLHVKEEEGVYYWTVSCDMYDVEDWDWEEIPKILFDELEKFNNYTATNR